MDVDRGENVELSSKAHWPIYFLLSPRHSTLGAGMIRFNTISTKHVAEYRDHEVGHIQHNYNSVLPLNLGIPRFNLRTFNVVASNLVLI